MEDDVTDIDEDSDDTPQRHYRLSKHPAEILLQQSRMVKSSLRFLTEESSSLALNGLTLAFST
ncbi:hypothetical protein HOY80DRAFT_1033270 [Tuber brumale]|nr:hypothetical protein HOY80DRAFT_1033270 [Tuber brumale]